MRVRARLDDIGRETYVPTLLDEQLRSALLGGEFRLIAVTGNAGDGKTAFIQQIEQCHRSDSYPGKAVERWYVLAGGPALHH